MQKRWNILAADEKKVNELYESLKIHPALCKILVQRGIDNYTSAKQYFRPQLSDLHDPWLMKDMEKAVARILTAFDRHEKIFACSSQRCSGLNDAVKTFMLMSYEHRV